MVNAGLIPITVVDDYLAGFWKKIFTNLTVHDTVTLRTGAQPCGADPQEQPAASRPNSTRSWRSSASGRRSAT